MIVSNRSNSDMYGAAQNAHVLICIVHVSKGPIWRACICMYRDVSIKTELICVLNTRLVAQGRYTSSESAKYMKHMHDQKANKMEEGHDTKHAKRRAIHESGGNPTLNRSESDPHPFWGDEATLTPKRIVAEEPLQ